MSAERIEAVSTSLFGYDAIGLLPQELKNRGAKRALIVTDQFLMESGVCDKVGKMLLAGGVEYAIYYQVQPNPTVTIVNECIAAAKALDVDWLVAVGGGSAIDTAKAVSIVLTNGGKVEDYEGVNRSVNPGLPIAAVNTTAGTGSEVTIFYIVTDPVKHSKMCMVDVNCKISIAINDTQFMTKMPKGLTAATGMDAMTHAIEAVLSKRATPLTDKDALWAIRTIKEYLPGAVANGADIEARDMMAYAAYTAGMAFSNGGLGMVHAMAHSLGGLYNLPHGICNAILLPHVLYYNAAHADTGTRFRKIAAALSLPDAKHFTEAQAAEESIEYIRKLSVDVGITQKLRDFEVDTKDFASLGTLALHDVCMNDNIVRPSISNVTKVYQAAF